MTPKNTTQNGDNDFLKTFGFITNEARRNLVVFFIVFLIFSNMFFVYRLNTLQNELNDCNQSKVDLTISLTQKITDEVRKQILPTTIKIERTMIKVDSVANKTQQIIMEKHK